jgi:biopolymer transport protein ExbD
MAAKDIISDTEDAKLNMTPMIDITFLLVVFFMLTIDLSSKEFKPVELPFASEGQEDKEDETEEVKRFVINLDGEGNVYFKQYEFNLSSEDPGVADDAIMALKDALRRMHEGNALWIEPDGASKVPVMVHADHAAKWKYVQWIMQACADPAIKIYKIQFAVKKPPTEEEKGG